MRNPAKKRDISFMITAICGASIATGLLMPPTVLGVNYNIGFIAVGSMVGLFALINGLMMLTANRAYQKLIAGQGLKAQWMVPPGLWREFVAYHAKLAPMNPQYSNVLKLTPNPPPEGVEVILGEQAVIVDGDYQGLPTYTNDCRFEAIELHPGPPMFINMHMVTVIHSKTGTRRAYHAVRFPVPPEAANDAADTVNWYLLRANELAIKSRSLVVRYPKAIRNISLIIAIWAAAACAIGFYCRNQPQMLDQDLALVLAIAGTIITPTALTMAVIGHVIFKSQQKAKTQAA